MNELTRFKERWGTAMLRAGTDAGACFDIMCHAINELAECVPAGECMMATGRVKNIKKEFIANVQKLWGD